jgi:hypothetical protein
VNFGEVTYVWNMGQYNTPDLENLPYGEYSLVAISMSGCVSYEDTSLAETFIAELVDLTECFNGENGHLTVQLDGGQMPYTVQWSNGADAEELMGLTPGTYTVLASDQAGCTVELNYVFPDAVECGCQGDLVMDGEIDIMDIMALLGEVGCAGICQFDLDGDEIVGVDDLIMVIAQFGGTCLD